MRYEVLKKILFKLDAENAYDIVMRVLEFGNNNSWIFKTVGRNYIIKDEILNQEILGLKFYNPIGLSAGFDRNATILKSLQNLGFGYLEAGTVTPKPQDGNEKPRIYRLEKNQSIQRYVGFDSKGMQVVKKNLSKFELNVPILINISRNRNTSNENAINDYKTLVSTLTNDCDIFTVNMSSPSTPALRNLQNEEFIKELFTNLKKLTLNPLAFKISPDFSFEKAKSLCSAAMNAGASILIISDSSNDYTLSPNIKEHKGGISGKLITHKSRLFLQALSKEFFGKVIIISSGGIDCAKEAYTRIRLGANLVQIYSAFIFNGPLTAKRMNKELIKLLKADGFDNISQAVGVDIKQENKKDDKIEIIQDIKDINATTI